MNPPRRPLGHRRAVPAEVPAGPHDRCGTPTAEEPASGTPAGSAGIGPADPAAVPDQDPAGGAGPVGAAPDTGPGAAAAVAGSVPPPPGETAPGETAPGETAPDDTAAGPVTAHAAAGGRTCRGGPGHPHPADGAPGEPDAASAPAGARASGDEPGPPLAAALEAILLVADQPVPEVTLAQLLERPQREIAAALHALAAEYTAAGRGFDLREVAGGWRYYTRASCAPVVERYVTDGQNARLTQAALETLAVVAYRQPVSRARVSAIRGVNCDGVMRTLLTRGLVDEAGTERETGAVLYRTTGYFLERMGLRSLDELPEIAPYLPEGATLEEIEAVEGSQ